MKSLRTICFALSVMLLGGSWSPRSASSEPGGLHLNITPFGGYADFAKEVNLDDRPEFGGRLGIGFGRYISIEGYYAWMSSHTRSPLACRSASATTFASSSVSRISSMLSQSSDNPMLSQAPRSTPPRSSRHNWPT